MVQNQQSQLQEAVLKHNNSISLAGEGTNSKELMCYLLGLVTLKQSMLNARTIGL